MPPSSVFIGESLRLLSRLEVWVTVAGPILAHASGLPHRIVPRPEGALLCWLDGNEVVGKNCEPRYLRRDSYYFGVL